MTNIRIIVAAALIAAIAVFVPATPDADAYTPPCVAQNGLSLNGSGHIDISGMSAPQWAHAYKSVVACEWGGSWYDAITAVYEDGTVYRWGYPFCTPYAACNS